MSSSFDTYRLHSFNERRRAEPIRLIFALANAIFEDIRYEKDDWSRVKSEMPLEQLPVLEFNGEKHPQSMAIVRFIARKFHFTGKSGLDQFKCDIIAETVQEMNERYFRAWFFPYKHEAEKKEEQKLFIEKYMPLQLTRIETLLDKYSKDEIHFVGDTITWVDLIVYCSLENLLEIDGQENLLNKYSKLKKNREEISKHPNIANYLKTRSQISN